MAPAGFRGFKSRSREELLTSPDIFSLIKNSFWFLKTLSRLASVTRRVPSLATTESAADLLATSSLYLASVNLGRSVDFDFPWVFKSGMGA